MYQTNYQMNYSSNFFNYKTNTKEKERDQKKSKLQNISLIFSEQEIKISNLQEKLERLKLQKENNLKFAINNFSNGFVDNEIIKTNSLLEEETRKLEKIKKSKEKIENQEEKILIMRRKKKTMKNQIEVNNKMRMWKTYNSAIINDLSKLNKEMEKESSNLEKIISKKEIEILSILEDKEDKKVAKENKKTTDKEESKEEIISEENPNINETKERNWKEKDWTEISEKWTESLEEETQNLKNKDINNETISNEETNKESPQQYSETEKTNKTKERKNTKENLKKDFKKDMNNRNINNTKEEDTEKTKRLEEVIKKLVNLIIKVYSNDNPEIKKNIDNILNENSNTNLEEETQTPEEENIEFGDNEGSSNKQSEQDKNSKKEAKKNKNTKAESKVKTEEEKNINNTNTSNIKNKREKTSEGNKEDYNSKVNVAEEETVEEVVVKNSNLCKTQNKDNKKAENTINSELDEIEDEEKRIAEQKRIKLREKYILTQDIKWMTWKIKSINVENQFSEEERESTKRILEELRNREINGKSRLAKKLREYNQKKLKIYGKKIVNLEKLENNNNQYKSKVNEAMLESQGKLELILTEVNGLEEQELEIKKWKAERTQEMEKIGGKRKKRWFGIF